MKRNILEVEGAVVENLHVGTWYCDCKCLYSVQDLSPGELVGVYVTLKVL